MKKAILATAFALSLVGCYVSVDNGTIPQENIAAAKVYEGIYTGKFEGAPLQMKIEIQDSGLAVLNFSGQVMAGCNSKVGLLTSLDIDPQTKSVNGAIFALDKGNCQIDGNTVYLDFNGANSVSVRIAQTIDHEPGDIDCDMHGHCHHTGGGTFYTWLTGSFSR